MLVNSHHYKPHVLSGGAGTRLRGKRRVRDHSLVDFGPHPWYSLWIVSSGYLRLLEPGVAPVEIQAPCTVVIEPVAKTKVLVPPSFECAWVEWGVRAVKLMPRRGGAGMKYSMGRSSAEANRQPGSEQVWGFPLPRILPEELFEYTQQTAVRIALEHWKSPIHQAVADGLLGQWIGSVVLHLQSARAEMSESRSEQNWLQRECGFLRNNLAKVPSVNAWARANGVAVYRLRQLCQEHASDTPKGVLDSIREEEARRLLKTCTCSVDEVALRTGFCSRRAFTRWFRGRMGKSPVQWRQD